MKKPTPRPWDWKPSKSDFSYIQVGRHGVIARTTSLDACNGQANAEYIGVPEPVRFIAQLSLELIRRTETK